MHQYICAKPCWLINYGIFALPINVVKNKFFKKSNLIFAIQLLSLLMLLAAKTACATPKIDSSKVALDSVPYFFHDDFSHHHLLDTSLNELHRYNQLFKNGNFYNITGHVTLPVRNVFYNPMNTDGLSFANTMHDGIYLNNNQVEFMHTYYPITTVKAVIGSKKEQFMELLHSQQIIPEVNIGFKIHGIRTAGYYNKQQSNTVGFQAFSSYLAKGGRYRSFFSYTYNRIVAQLNGGLQPDSAFSYTYETLTDKALIPVYLNSASHQLYGSDVYTKQVIGLDKILKKAELSAMHDSCASLNKIVIYGRYQEYFRHHTDQFLDSTYYQNYYITQEVYKDKIRAQKTKASVALLNTVAGNAVDNYIGYELQAGIENLDVTLIDYKKNYFTTYINALLAKNFGFFSAKAEAKYFLNGYNKSNYQAVFSLQSLPNQLLKWEVNAGANALNPEVINNYYTSNNFFWENNFKAINHTFVNANIAHKKVGNLLVQYSVINNYVYFDSLAVPSQFNTSNSLLQIKYFKIFKWKALRFAPEVLFQLDASKEQILGLPTYFTKTSLYFEQRIFKKHLLFQIGTDVFWLNSYRPYTYMAATNQFFYQTKFNTGNLPVADFFIAFKISTVQAFVRLEQLSTIVTEPYFYSPYYAMPGFTFKIGINWLFIN
jgi:hypothetical protein